MIENSGHYFQPYIRGLFIFVGLFFLFYWYLNFRKINQMKNNGIISVGKIIDIQALHTLDEIRYYPIVEFTTENGKIIREKMEGRLSQVYRYGEEVEIFYNINNPKDFLVNTHYETDVKNYPLLLGSLISFLLGILG